MIPITEGMIFWRVTDDVDSYWNGDKHYTTNVLDLCYCPYIEGGTYFIMGPRHTEGGPLQKMTREEIGQISPLNHKQPCHQIEITGAPLGTRTPVYKALNEAVYQIRMNGFSEENVCAIMHRRIVRHLEGEFLYMKMNFGKPSLKNYLPVFTIQGCRISVVEHHSDSLAHIAFAGLPIIIKFQK